MYTTSTAHTKKPVQRAGPQQFYFFGLGETDVTALFNELDLNKDGAIELSEWLEALPRGAKLKSVTT